MLCNQCFGIVIQLLQHSQKHKHVQFLLSLMQPNKLNTKWHLCVFGCKHLDWLSLCMRVEQQVSLCIYGCSEQRAPGALGFTLWNWYGWAAFLRPNPKSAVDGQTTQLSALTGAQWGCSQQRQPPVSLLWEGNRSVDCLSSALSGSPSQSNSQIS